jgi:hypothetical protein
MSDPMDPGWRPEYTGDTSLGNVGSGGDFGADLYYLYRAGRNELPQVARVYSHLTTVVHHTEPAMRTLFKTNVGINPAHMLIFELRANVHEVLRQTCVRMGQVGDALVEIAALYAATDEEAAEAFRGRLDKVEDPNNLSKDAENWLPRPPSVREPPEVGDPHPEGPMGPGGHLAP